MNNSGWICPKCEAVMAPFHPTCWYCKPKKEERIPEPMKLPSCRHGIVGKCEICDVEKAKPYTLGEKGYDGHICYATDVHRIDLIAGSTINPVFEIPL
jgi:hypothetical protein